MELSEGVKPSRLSIQPGGIRDNGRRVRSLSAPPDPRRRLSIAETRATLAALNPPPDSLKRLHLQIISDLSGSMSGTNDAAGLRHEAALIAVQRITGFGVRGRRPRVKLTAELLSFDLTTALDLATIDVDRSGFRSVERALLSAPLGGSSNLGPALQRAEQNLPSPCLRVILSDFELFDPDTRGVISRASNSTVEHTLALVFRSAPPSDLQGPHLTVKRVDPDNDPATVVANLIIGALQHLDVAAVTR